MKQLLIMMGVIGALSLAIPANAAMIGGHGQVTLREIGFPSLSGDSGLATMTVSYDAVTETFNNGHAHISIRIGEKDYRQTFSLQDIPVFDPWVRVGVVDDIPMDLQVIVNFLLSEARFQAEQNIEDQAVRRGIELTSIPQVPPLSI